MFYPEVTRDHLSSFERDGFLVVDGVIPPADLAMLTGISTDILQRKEKIARDWDWRRGEAREGRRFRIVQCGVTPHHPWMRETRLREWTVRFASSLMRQPLDFWYDQFLGKPPSHGAPTPWHQDEAYWGRELWDCGITCWVPFHDVDVDCGTMHFVRGGHKHGLLEHSNPPEMASDLLVCDVATDADIVACRLKAGSVTFHHSKTPHMTTGNTSDRWRLAMAQHMKGVSVKDERGHYRWRVDVSQVNNERVHAVSGQVDLL
ncbi:MAG TPA: phytanoyl-CoA dioxygenase family protein [Planctomycetota bacterium]|nr:phytanoyl-CoA dioxygenase family protein [Planctomycetota bacterium]